SGSPTPRPARPPAPASPRPSGTSSHRPSSPAAAGRPSPAPRRRRPIRTRPARWTTPTAARRPVPSGGAYFRAAGQPWSSAGRRTGSSFATGRRAGRRRAPSPPRARAGTRLSGRARHLGKAPLQVCPLGAVLGQLQGAAVGDRGVVQAVEPAEEVGAGGVEPAVVGQRAGDLGPLDQGEALRRPLGHRDGSGAVELDDR